MSLEVNFGDPNSGVRDTWHEYVIPLSGQFHLNAVWKIGIQFFAPVASVDAGADAESVTDGAGDAAAESDGPVEPGSTGGPGDAEAGSSDAANVADADPDGGTAPEADAGTLQSSPIVVHVDYIWIE